jgi:serine protease AprX
VLDANGSGSDSSVIAAIDRAIELKSQYNIRVMNLSLGRQIYESHTLDPLCLAVRRAWEAGIVVVVAAGNMGRYDSAQNDGYGTIMSPGNSPYVITVGATKTRNTYSRTDDEIASYSAKGPTRFDLIVKPDLVAPGNAITSLNAPGSTLYNLRPGRHVGSSYFKMSGTSMAAPMVSGAAALMIEQDPNLTPDQVKARLMKTAWKLMPRNSSYFDPPLARWFRHQYDIFTVGAGYLDIHAALLNTDLAVGSALSPSVSYDSLTSSTRIMHSLGVVWGDSVLWGTGVVWGEAVLWGQGVVWGLDGRELNGTAVVWGNGVVWGDSTCSGFGVIWGQGVVWGETTVAYGSALSSELTDEDGDPPAEDPI